MGFSVHGPSKDRVKVLLPLPLSCPYDYSLPTAAVMPPGTFVRVPLKGRTETGVVWHCSESAEVHETRRKCLRPVLKVLDIPSLPAVVMRFIDWVAAYTLAPPGAVLRMSVPAALGHALPSRFFSSCTGERSETEVRIATNFQQTTHNSSVQEVGQAVERPFHCLADPADALSALSSSQKSAAAELRAVVRAKKFSITLLKGVTGSGKTEVYFEAVAEVLRSGFQVLVLLPEIALTTQCLDDFAHRFGVSPATWHSSLTPKARRWLWRAVVKENISLVVGTRSALFLPYPNLGLIVVDEEHEWAFKQEGRVLYHARDRAVVRGRLGKHAVILASATPSLETRVNVAIRRYGLVKLSVHSGGTPPMPNISAIDMRRMNPEYKLSRKFWLSPPLVKAIKKTLSLGEQVMLFLNRRGYAPLTLCRACGFRFRCPHCTAWLVEHRHLRGLICHHCGYGTDLPSRCPRCWSSGPFAVCGPGVERIAEETANLFPAARLALMTSENLKGPVKEKTALMQKIAAGGIDVLIGTQIMAKGYSFPRLSLVGIVDADLGLSGGDLRAAERTFQLLWQVAGRTGQGSRPGRVLVQTYDPFHPVMDALLSGLHERFYTAEAAQRRDAGMPPFGQLAALIVSGLNGEEVGIVAAELARNGPSGPDVTVLGPAPAPLAVLRDRHRYRLLLKARPTIRVQPLLRAWLEKIRWPRTVRVQVDINPYNFL